MIEPPRAVHRCADRDTWQDLLDERIDEADQPALLAHLDTCPACTQTVAELAGKWSLATRQDQRTNEGPATQAIRERIVGTHALPPPPTIPDIADLTLAGRGGMGAVYRGRDTRLDRPVAVKVLAGAGVFSPSSRARLEREARVLARLDHPNIVRIHSAGVTDGVPYIVMEWIDGRTLPRRISEAVLPPREAARIALALAEAVAAVHAVGIVHRD
ncbi:MAG: protein kinase, partial [Planctomycetota bacterium]